MFILTCFECLTKTPFSISGDSLTTGKADFKDDYCVSESASKSHGSGLNENHQFLPRHISLPTS
jgi:hypothetical protein